MRRLSIALLVSGCLALPAFAQETTQQQQKPQQIQVAFVLDTTGSMVDLIEGAKQKIWSVANSILDVNPDAEISMSLIGYRDRGDAYVVQAHHMTEDVQGIYSDLRRFEADGGGDTPEAVNEALDAAVRGEDWAEGDNVRRIIVLVGDAPPHMDYQNAPRYAEVISAARNKGIVVNTIQAGNDPETREYWMEMARLGGGQYHAIPQDGGQITQVPTPFDDQIIQIQTRIDATIQPYGSVEQQASVTDKVAERSSASASVRADNSSFYAKKGAKREAVTGGGDLIADIANGEVTLDAVPEAEMSTEMQAMPEADRKIFIETKTAERTELEKEMAALVEQRDAYIAENAPKTEGDSFDVSVKRSLAEQLK